MKVLFNTCYGGFSLSKEFQQEFVKRWPEKADILDLRWNQPSRSDPDLIALFEELGSEKSSGHYANIEIDEIPDNVDFHVSEYDGMEHVKWSLPTEKIIQDLIDIIKGRKTEEDVNQFTKRLLQNDTSAYSLRRQLISEIETEVP